MMRLPCLGLAFRLLSLLSLLVLAGCGGGGGGGGGGGDGGGAAPPPPAPSYRVGGTLSGLPVGGELTVAIGAEHLVLRANGSFLGTVQVPAGTSYAVQVVTAPAERRCVVSNGSGVVGSADVTTVLVDCSPALTWVTDGEVNAAALSPDRRTLYIGGTFERVGPPSGSFVSIDPATGARRPGHAVLHGDVIDAIADGDGGVYVSLRGRGDGGASGVPPASTLARLNANGARDVRFGLAGGGTATALLRHGSRLFVATNRASGNNVLVLDASTGASLGIGMRAQFPLVDALAYDEASNTLFVGGSFTSAGPEGAELPRMGVAAFDAGTGALRSWDARANSFGGLARISSLAVAGGRLIVAGTFSQIGGQDRAGLAALDIQTAQATAWDPCDPTTRGSILRVLPVGNTVFVAGSFRVIGGATRIGVAQIALDTGRATGWDAGLGAADSTEVHDLGLGSDRIYLSGVLSVGGNPADAQTAAAMLSDGSLRPTPLAIGPFNGSVRRVLPTGDKLWVGGNFRLYGGVARRGIAALDLQSGEATTFAADTAADTPLVGAYGVHQIIVSGNAVIVRGRFDAIGGTRRNQLAALDGVTGAVLPWDAALPRDTSSPSNGLAYAMASDGARLYVGGQFNAFGGQPRNNLAAVDLGTWGLTDWAPTVARVDVLAAGNGRVYASEGPAIAAIEAGSSLRTPGWTSPVIATRPPGSAVSTLVALPQGLFLAGLVDSVAGQSRSAAALDRATGALLPWNPGLSLNRQKLLTDGEGGLYMVRERTGPTGNIYWELLAMDLATAGTQTLLATDGDIHAVARAPEGLYVAGNFGLSGSPRQHLVLLPR